MPFFVLLERGQALLTWLSGESQWQEASRAINPEGWGSVENGQPSQFSARLPFSLLLPLSSLCVDACKCYSDDLILFFCSFFRLSRWCSPMKHFLFVARQRFWLALIETQTQRLKALFVENVSKCRMKRHLLQQQSEAHVRAHLCYLAKHCKACGAEWQFHYDCCWHIRSQLSTLAYSLFNCLI